MMITAINITVVMVPNADHHIQVSPSLILTQLSFDSTIHLFISLHSHPSDEWCSCCDQQFSLFFSLIFIHPHKSSNMTTLNRMIIIIRGFRWNSFSDVGFKACMHESIESCFSPSVSQSFIHVPVHYYPQKEEWRGRERTKWCSSSDGISYGRREERILYSPPHFSNTSHVSLISLRLWDFTFFLLFFLMSVDPVHATHHPHLTFTTHHHSFLCWVNGDKNSREERIIRNGLWCGVWTKKKMITWDMRPLGPAGKEKRGDQKRMNGKKW